MPLFLAYLLIFINVVALGVATAMFVLMEQVQRYEAASMMIQPAIWYTIVFLPLLTILAMAARRWFRTMIVSGILVALLGGSLLTMAMTTYVDDQIQPRTVINNAFGLPDVDDFGDVKFEENPEYAQYQNRLLAQRLLAAGILITGIGLIVAGAFARSLLSPIESIPKEYRNDHR